VPNSCAIRQHQTKAQGHCPGLDVRKIFFLQQPLPEPVPKEQDVHADHDGYHREHVKHDGCLSSDPSLPLGAAEWSQSGAKKRDGPSMRRAQSACSSLLLPAPAEET